jgi:hypothetical protein
VALCLGYFAVYYSFSIAQAESTPNRRHTSNASILNTSCGFSFRLILRGAAMTSTVTLSLFAVVAIFLAGVGVGWFISAVRVRGSINVDLSPSNAQSNTQPGFGSSMRLVKAVRTGTSRSLTLKCACGSTWKFTDGTNALPSDQPIPQGDSFVCPKCGKSIDLKLEHQLEEQAAEALRNRSLQA